MSKDLRLDKPRPRSPNKHTACCSTGRLLWNAGQLPRIAQMRSWDPTEPKWQALEPVP